MCKKRSASCFGALLFDRCLEMCLQNGSVLCICSSAWNLSLVRGFGVASGVSVTLVKSGVTVSALGYRVRSSVICMHCAGSTSDMECRSIMIGCRWTFELWLSCPVEVLPVCSRQSAALFWGSWYPFEGNVICCEFLTPICLLCHWHSFHWEILPVVFGHCIW